MPWEFKDMTLQEYQNYSHGYFLRLDRNTIPIRRIYTLLYNSRVQKSKQLISVDAISQHWPLLTDKFVDNRLSAEEKQRRLEKAAALTAKMRQKANGGQ